MTSNTPQGAIFFTLLLRFPEIANGKKAHKALKPPSDSMDNKEFATTRKRLKKTQKELASLLGISLKAVCSYEQGWRSIPGHVERQLIFLLARKIYRFKECKNCWDIRNCPDEKKLNCPAWEFDSGKFCWFTTGTLCENTPHKTWSEKILMCKKCVIMKKLM